MPPMKVKACQSDLASFTFFGFMAFRHDGRPEFPNLGILYLKLFDVLLCSSGCFVPKLCTQQENHLCIQVLFGAYAYSLLISPETGKASANFKAHFSTYRSDIERQALHL